MVKSLHRLDLFGWSTFDTLRDLDFNSVLWAREPHGNIAFDPLPVTEHDAAHIRSEGGVDWVYLTNADHVRAAAWFKREMGARIAAPVLERHLPEYAGFAVDLWLEPGQRLANGVECIAMAGSKTPGELAFLLPGSDTAICGDLVRGPRAGALGLLADAKLADRAAAIDAVRYLAARPGLQAVLVGDGQSVFRDARALLVALLATLD